MSRHRISQALPERSQCSPPDVWVMGGGTVSLFVLLTDSARAWVDEYVSTDRQMLGNGLAVEHRYAGALAERMQQIGLVIENEGDDSGVTR